MKVISFWILVVVLTVVQSCNDTVCNNENCRCMSSDNPGGFFEEDVPQFVMLTYDDAVNAANYGFYHELFVDQDKKDQRGCTMKATFYVCHEYTNYAQLHHLWKAGNEIAVHTITHESSTDMWRRADSKRLTREIQGMREFISEFGQIPLQDIVGFRNPFLQTAGDTTFQVLQEKGFLYDTSMPTRQYAGEATFSNSIWPYTLDYGYTQDCIIHPCPTKNYPGLWEVPMISFFKSRIMIDGQKPVLMPCSMADACLPWPETKQDTYDYFIENFNRHYLKNKAPFPVFLHESWLRDEERRAGYVQFLDYLLEQDDVFVVTVKEVLDYIKNPVPLEEYKQKPCVVKQEDAKCSASGTYCNYDKTPLWGSRIMNTCTSTCPNTYPWL